MCISPAEVQYGMSHQSASFISHGLDAGYTLLLCWRQSNDDSTTDGSEILVQTVVEQFT